jgi:hypothetical protein
MLPDTIFEGVPKSFRTGSLERELQMVQLSATSCSCISILWVSIVSVAAITLYVTSHRVFFVVSVYFVTDSVRKLLDIPSHTHTHTHTHKYKIYIINNRNMEAFRTTEK